MPNLKTHNLVAADLKRLHKFLETKNTDVAKRATGTIKEYVNKLKTSPYLGAWFGEYRRLVVPFGRTAYLVFYHFEEDTDTVHIVHIAHGREDIKLPSLSTFLQ